MEGTAVIDVLKKHATGTSGQAILSFRGDREKVASMVEELAGAFGIPHAYTGTTELVLNTQMLEARGPMIAVFLDQFQKKGGQIHDMGTRVICAPRQQSAERVHAEAVLDLTQEAADLVKSGLLVP